MKHKVISIVAIATLALATTPVAFAKTKYCKKHHCHRHPAPPQYIVYKDELPPVQIYAFIPHFYAGGHVGVSRTHDNPAVGTANSVTQIGPGWTADLGYQFFQFYRAIFAGEIGYTQYHNSNETARPLNIAYTEHFAAYGALVGEYPLPYNFNILGKLGVAYSYARKTFNAGGASASANDYSPYYGGGLTYNMTNQAELVLQWNRVRGNNRVGSTDLTSLGVSYHFL